MQKIKPCKINTSPLNYKHFMVFDDKKKLYFHHRAEKLLSLKKSAARCLFTVYMHISSTLYRMERRHRVAVFINKMLGKQTKKK